MINERDFKPCSRHQISKLYKLDLTNQHYSTNIIFAWGKSRIINQNIAQNFFPYRKRYAYFQTIIAAEKPLSPHTNNYLALVSTLSFAERLRLALFIFFINLHNEYEFCIRARDHRYLAYLFEHLRFQLKPRSKNTASILVYRTVLLKQIAFQFTNQALNLFAGSAVAS